MQNVKYIKCMLLPEILVSPLFLCYSINQATMAEDQEFIQ